MAQHRNRPGYHARKKLRPTLPDVPGFKPVDEVDSREEARAAVVRKLRDPGRYRRNLVKELANVDHELRPLIVEAARAGLPYRRIEELTGISNATVTRLVAKAKQEEGKHDHA